MTADKPSKTRSVLTLALMLALAILVRWIIVQATS